MSHAEKNLPLEGIKVLAFTHAVMGPAAGLILADLGAEVIHIEPPTGDSTRRLKGFGVGYFPFFNRNKKSLAIDLKASEGKDIILKLAADADIVLENFGPGTIDRLGYGYEALSAMNPRLIYVSLKGFLPGPYEHRVAMDEVVQMMGGLAYMTGPPGQPLRAGSSIIDVSGGMFGAMGAITALYDRERTGKGTYIKGALFETTAFIMGQHMAYAALVEDPVPPMPARVSAWSVYKLFETKDNQQVFIGIISEKHWQKFCQAFGREEWLTDERLQSNNDRIRERDWLLPAVEKLIKQFTKEEVIKICDTAGICFAPIARPEDLFDDPQLNQGDYGLLDTEFPGGEKTKMPRLPLQFGSYDLKKRNDPPAAIGADTREVLESLGYDDDKISELVQKKIIAVGKNRR
ncbi:MAG: CaiB/BaiF CoA-transferase family protein [Desulfobacterales bacterium]|jgi:crotonobetainyl-CoA:carnitine CoA-transferase CaiB-like acyl-CoA transferase